MRFCHVEQKNIELCCHCVIIKKHEKVCKCTSCLLFYCVLNKTTKNAKNMETADALLHILAGKLGLAGDVHTKTTIEDAFWDF